MYEKKVKINRLQHEKTAENNHTLTDLQDKAVKAILKSTDKPLVLFGVTGSGKTEVYMHSIEKILKENKRALMLVPEISLTPQMVRVFSARFGSEVAVLHSALSMGEKHDEWLRIYRGEAKIVVGARSAIFAPIKDLGIIIIDEEHDNSYLSDSNPRYFTHDIAEFRAKQNKCPLVLGSATPSIETFYKAKTTKEYNLVEMPVRVNKQPMPPIEIVDMCQQFKLGNNTMLSASLIDKLTEQINNDKQSILLSTGEALVHILCVGTARIFLSVPSVMQILYSTKTREFLNVITVVRSLGHCINALSVRVIVLNLVLPVLSKW